jgi:hypothetical protein
MHDYSDYSDVEYDEYGNIIRVRDFLVSSNESMQHAPLVNAYRPSIKSKVSRRWHNSIKNKNVLKRIKR